MSDIQLRHGHRPLPRPLPPLRSGQRRAQARQGARRRRPTPSSPTSRTPSRRRRRTRPASSCATSSPRRGGPARSGSSASTPSARAFHADDLAAVAAIAPDAIVLPKATPEAVDALGAGRARPSSRSSRRRRASASRTRSRLRPRVAALQIGAVDLGAEVGLEPRPDGLEILYVRSKVVLDSAAAGLCGRRSTSSTSTSTDGGRARGGVPPRALARLPRQGVHPPVAGARSSTAPSRRARRSSRGREAWSTPIEAASGRGPWRRRARRGDDRPAGRRAGAAAARGTERR